MIGVFIKKLRKNSANNLFRFSEVCDMSKVVDTAHIKPSASSLTAESRYHTGLCLPLRHVHCTYLDTSTHRLQQPFITIHIVPLQMQVQHPIPAIHSKRKGKEEYLYSAILADTPLTKHSDMDHTVLLANYTMSAFPL